MREKSRAIGNLISLLPDFAFSSGRIFGIIGKYLVTGTIKETLQYYENITRDFSCDQLLFGKSGGLLSDMIDRFHAVAASQLRCGTVFGFPTVDNMTFPAA